MAATTKGRPVPPAVLQPDLQADPRAGLRGLQVPAEQEPLALAVLVAAVAQLAPVAQVQAVAPAAQVAVVAPIVVRRCRSVVRASTTRSASVRCA